jgi:hypothetical protein
VLGVARLETVRGRPAPKQLHRRCDLLRADLDQLLKVADPALSPGIQVNG